MNNIYYSMILPTPKQMIEKLTAYDGIVLGALNSKQIIGLSNDFYTEKILTKVNSQIHDLEFASKIITPERTLWLITVKRLNIFKQYIT